MLTPAPNELASILIIDDDEQIVDLLMELLKDKYSCVSVSSAEAALVVLETKTFSLVISDINMGRMTGIDLIPLVHRKAPDTVVVMVSGRQTIETAIQAMRAGAFDYVTKPFDLRHVDAAVERALRHNELLLEKRRHDHHLEELVAQRTAEVERLAYYDTRTGLANRVLFEDRLVQAVTVAQRTGQMLGTLFLALDRSRKVNDTLGHAVGDLLFREVAERLKRCVSDTDTVALFDGDEFALLLPQVTGTKDMVEISRSISEALKPPFFLDGHEVYLTVSIGISLFPFDGDDSGTLLRNAGAALYRAKIQGGNNYQFYRADMNAGAVKRLTLESSLRRAVEHEEFVVHYQSQVDIESRNVVGVEALVRWEQPELGLMQPAEFIALAEDTGLILPIGAWVLRTACAQTRAWQRAGLNDLCVAVNVSPRQFQDKNLLDTIVRALDDSGLAARYLELELTESSIMRNAEAAVRTLAAVRELGVRVAIDDFGTGYSSLGYLKRLPLDLLKLDRAFVNGATSDPDDAALVMAIITLAHNLRLKVIAEGVETEEHLRFLRLLKCDRVQGYLFGAPVAADQFQASLAGAGLAREGKFAVLPVSPGDLLTTHRRAANDK